MCNEQNCREKFVAEIYRTKGEEMSEKQTLSSRKEQQKLEKKKKKQISQKS